MNVSLSNLFQLKTQVLAPSLVASTDYDARLTALGLGVASAFENFCNRKFARAAAATQILAADRCQFLLNRFPLESLAQYELKKNEVDGFIVQDLRNVQTVDLVSGIVFFSAHADLGQYFNQVRFTFAGGYFWETLEPTDGGYPTAPPAGSAALPDDLRLAFYLQCKRTWEALDKIGDKISEVGPGEKGGRFELGIGGVDLSPLVKQMLQQYIRINLV